MLSNPQPLSGWEVPTKPATSADAELNQQPPNSLSQGSAVKAATTTTMMRSSIPSEDAMWRHPKRRPKQMGLFNPSFSGHRDPLGTGPGARLIPWFLPEHRGNPDQKQSKNTSLRASSLSMKNSSTIYLSCLIEDITGELGYVYSILYSSLSTLPLLQAPFPNPPTSNKHIINHIVSFSHPTTLNRSTYINYQNNSSTPMNTLSKYALLLSSQQIYNLSKPLSRLITQRSTCRTFSFKRPMRKVFKSINYKFFWSVNNLNKSHLLATCKAFRTVINLKYFWTVINLNKIRSPVNPADNPANAKSINKNDLNSSVRLSTKRRRLSTKRTRYRPFTKRIRRRRTIRTQHDQESESDLTQVRNKYPLKTKGK